MNTKKHRIMLRLSFCWSMLMLCMISAPKNLTPAEKHDYFDMMLMGGEL